MSSRWWNRWSARKRTSSSSKPSLRTELVGYRLWRPGVDSRGPVLWSVITLHRWQGPVAGPADIAADGGPWSPHKQGLYAFSDVASLRQRWTGGLLAGTVSLWGNVALHERGYRAEYAQILALARPIRCMLCHAPATALVPPPGEGPAYACCAGHASRRRNRLDLAAVLDHLALRYEVPLLDDLVDSVAA